MDWSSIIVALIVSFPAWLAYWKSRKNSTQIQEVKVSIDGRMEELLRATKGQATAEGHAAGVKEGQNQ